MLDQVQAIQGVARLGSELTMDERNLLSVGYKHVIGLLRSCEVFVTLGKALLAKC